jgi:hypothetical protein
MFPDRASELSRGVRLTESYEYPCDMRLVTTAILLTAALLMVPPRAAFAQSDPPVGVRAAGMAGAFTALADDATATFWNPAGLALGSLAGFTLDASSFDRQPTIFAGLSTPPLGLSYYRQKVAATSTAPEETDRNGVVVHHAGVTVVQSLGDRNLAVGSTLKVVHGNGATAFDADAGFLASGSLGKIGVTVHNLVAPSLGDLALQRRVRAGLAINARQDLVVSADVEFTRTATALGDWRDAAIGLEAHPHTRIWLRSGVHWNTTGDDAAPVGAVGGSYAVYGSLRADAQASFGAKNGNKGWGIGLSFIY